MSTKRNPWVLIPQHTGAALLRYSPACPRLEDAVAEKVGAEQAHTKACDDLDVLCEEIGIPLSVVRSPDKWVGFDPDGLHRARVADHEREEALLKLNGADRRLTSRFEAEALKPDVRSWLIAQGDTISDEITEIYDAFDALYLEALEVAT